MTRSGEKIVIFSGGKNSDSFKRIRGNSYGMWIATEINLHADSFIKEAFNRQLAAKDRRVFWDLNPSSPDHFIYRDYIDKFASLEAESFYNYGHFTIRDNALITPERLAEIVAQYDETTVWYKRDILGERIAAEGLIYRRFADAPAAFTIDHVPPDKISVECDADALPRYGSDYALGDLCDVYDEELGLSFEMRITSVDTVWENGRKTVFPSFGDEIRSIRSLFGSR